MCLLELHEARYSYLKTAKRLEWGIPSVTRPVAKVVASLSYLKELGHIQTLWAVGEIRGF